MFNRELTIKRIMWLCLRNKSIDNARSNENKNKRELQKLTTKMNRMSALSRKINTNTLYDEHPTNYFLITVIITNMSVNLLGSTH